MKNIFQRIRDNVLADIHAVLDEKERKSPIALLNQYLRDCERETNKIEALIQRHQKLQREFFREKEQARILVEKRTKQAEIARQAGETTLEERALQDISYYTERAEHAEKLYNDCITQTEQLQDNLQEARRKLQEMQTKRLELMARENMAHTHRRINDSMHKLSENNPFFKFDEIEQQMKEIELRVNADYERDTFDYRIARLEQQQKEVERKTVEA
ncbi:PspA/IM30 family protein [Priestia taiwanensis]|uniref:Phage shock protein A n=1 Tax=Priestia taiwanensis TaxID=1347902 RepID=A0A917AVX4_9BACI|nr:PspA/IM30 family protein [Priestia taiwanensis]MBM7363407.1 phage shock protein A [Priestia taiwanensis]GGE77424.1 phage shock protein A [Priestia taiwanensis]